MTTLDHPSAHALPTGGERLTFLGMEMQWLITRDMSDGAFAQFLHISPPGTGVPLHVHHDEPESVYVVEGEVITRVGDVTSVCRTGDAIMLPQGVPHAWRVGGEAPARLLATVYLARGTDWETMFRGLVGLAPTDFEHIKAIAARNHIEFLDPPTFP